MKRLMAVCAAVVWAACSVASAQTPNPVMQHYRAYRTAMEANDLATAEAEAEAAVTASEARDGQGGRTGVLLLNLATTRLLRGEGAQAVEPAQRAVTLAESSAEGVGGPLARLTLARAQLATGDAAAAARLQTALADPTAAELGVGDKYVAASELAAWATANAQFEMARAAWRMAADNADGSPYGRDYSIGSARTGEAVAMLLEEIVGHHGAQLDQGVALSAHQLLVEAKGFLRPLALQAPLAATPNLAQEAYATAIAWHDTLRAKLINDGHPILERRGRVEIFAQDFAEFGAVDPDHPRCEIEWNGSPGPDFRGGAAAVVFRVHVNEAGGVAESAIIAHAGDDGFGAAIARVFPQWRASRKMGSPRDCTMERVMFVPVTFAANYQQ